MNTDEKQRETITVSCARPGGLVLRLYKNHEREDNPPQYETVTLNGGTNTLDKRFVDCWLEENPDADLVKNGTISIVDPEDEKRERAKFEGGKPGVDNIVERPDKEASITDPEPEKENDGKEQSSGNETPAA